MKFPPPRPGYTLLEILLVMAILVILTAVSLPTLSSMYGDSRVRGAGDEVRRAWAEARSRSIDRGVPYRFAVMADKENYRVAPDAAEFWDGSASGSAEAADDGKVLTGSIGKQILFRVDPKVPEDAGGWRNIVVFLPDGTCRGDARVVVEADDCQPLAVSVRGLTGIVTVRTRKQEEER